VASDLDTIAYQAGIIDSGISVLTVMEKRLGANPSATLNAIAQGKCAAEVSQVADATSPVSVSALKVLTQSAFDCASTVAELGITGVVQGIISTVVGLVENVLQTGFLAAMAIEGGVSGTTSTITVSRSAAPPAGGAGVVSLDGSVGNLRFGNSTQADVYAAAGTPAATAEGNFGLPGAPNYEALGYQCSSNPVPAANSTGPILNLGGPPYCLTVYYLDASTGLLEAFATASPNFRTTRGTTVGMTSAKAQQLEGQPDVDGCFEGISLAENNPATILIDIPNPAGPPPSPTDMVTELESETSAGAPGVGLLFC
jgi:hypothetical protein